MESAIQARAGVRFEIKATLFWLVAALATVGPSWGQVATTSKETESKIDFARCFFTSPQIELESRSLLSTRFAELKQLRGKLGVSAENLLHALQLRDELRAGYEKHDAYLYLRYATNTRDIASLHEEQRLWAEAMERISLLDIDIAGISKTALRGFLAGSPELRQRAFEIETLLRAAPHHGPVGTEAIVPQLTGWQSELHDLLSAHTKAAPIAAGGKSLDPNHDRMEIATSADAEVRREGFKRRYRSHREMRDLYAFTLLRLVESNNKLAQLHSFPDAPSEHYFDSFLTVEDVHRLLAWLAANADIHKNYEQLRARHVRESLTLNEAYAWDLGAAPEAGPRFSLSQARKTIAEALAPLGQEYVDEISSLLDPANGRFDAGTGAARKPGGFSKGGFGFPSVLFAGRFSGTYNDVRVLAHEGGHAVHRQFMNASGVLPSYATGPPLLFESFAILNELLLADYLYHGEKEPARRSYYLEQFLDGKGMIAFIAGPEAELEQEVYESSLRGEINSPDDLDGLTARVFGKYSIWPAKTPELQNQWMMIPLMYEDPFYDLNYVYGGLLGLKYYEMLKADPEAFRTKYIALLKNGFDDPPDALLKRFLGIDLHDQVYAEDAMRALSGKVKELERSY